MDKEIRYFVSGWSFRLGFTSVPGYGGDHEDISDGDSYELGEYENSEEALAAAEVDTVKIDGVKVDSFDSKVDVNSDVKVDSDFDTGFYTDADGKSAGRQSAQVENEAVKIASHPKNIDDRYKNTSTSTAVADGEGATDSGIPTRKEVRSHFAEMGFAVDPDRFFDVNEGRGWRTNSGKPVDDWKKLAAVWDRNEHPKAATPPARTEPKANAVGKIPSVEEVMAKWGCDRETAQGYIDENMY